MIFAILLMDRPGTAELRVQIRSEHRAYLANLSDRMAFAGPLTSEDGKTTVGSLLAIDFPSRSDLDAWLKDEPFTKAGVYEKPIIHVFTNMWPQKVGFPPAN
ncbi:YciI family protein [Polynucleobacter sp. MWH-Creno-3A4]|nr:YciI family protein [Polynucleobacter sp. MWH-Creno-3A4]MBU3605151.1 YciI family protein [Polynucleobacter sp. MWH-Creno-3A4]